MIIENDYHLRLGFAFCYIAAFCGGCIGMGRSGFFLRAGLGSAVLAAAFAALSAPSALAADEVNLYSDRQRVFLQPVIAAFEEESGATVNTFFAKSGLLERVRAEGATSPADVLILTDIGRLAAFADAGLLAAVADAELRAAFPPALRDPDNRWFAVTRRGRIIYAAPEAADADFASYLNLADEKWRGSVCSRSGRHPYNIALIASVIAKDGEAAARKWLDGWRRNLARRPRGNDRDQIRAVAAGECKIAVANTYYFFKLLDGMSAAEQDELRAKVRMIFPAAGAYINISGMALAKNAPHPQAALAFMRFLAGKRAQRIYAEVNREFPARADIALPPALAEFAADFVADDLPLAEIAAHRGRASALVEAVGFDLGP